MYHTPTRAAYEDFVETAEKQGAKWSSGKKPTQIDVFHKYEKRTAFVLTRWGLQYGPVGYFAADGYKGIFKWIISDKHPTITEHIIRGNKTIVKLSNGKVGIARCHPDDEFDIYEGLRIATARAYGKDAFTQITIDETVIRRAIQECESPTKSLPKRGLF